MFISLNCTSKKYRNLEVNVSFRHSFAKPINFRFEKTRDAAKAFVEVLTYGESYDSLVLIQKDSNILSKKELARFFDILGNTPLLNLRSDSSGMFDADGGETYFSITQDEGKNEFVAGDGVTLERGNAYERLIEATFYMLYAKFPELEKFIEENHLYHPHDLAVKVRGQNPRQVRLWGRYFNNDSLLLSKLLKEIPEEEPIIIDISNIATFHDVESMLSDFQRTHKKMAWVIGEVQRNDGDYMWEFYKRFELDTTRMFRDTIEAKKYLLKIEKDESWKARLK